MPCHAILCCAVLCRVGVQMSRVEVKFSNLDVSADVMVGSRAMPTVANAFVNTPLVRVCVWDTLLGLETAGGHPLATCCDCVHSGSFVLVATAACGHLCLDEQLVSG